MAKTENEGRFLTNYYLPSNTPFGTLRKWHNQKNNPKIHMLTRLIAHQITKKAHQTTASLRFRDTILPADAPVAVELFDQLRDSFRNGNPVAGAFLTAGGTVSPFQQILTRYLEANTDPAFVTFTRDAMSLLRNEMAGQQAATGGQTIKAWMKDKRAS